MTNPPKLELQISGMDCASCALGIERSLKKLGVKQVTVDFSSSSAFISPGQVAVDQIVSEVRGLGYTVAERTAGTHHHTDEHGGHTKELHWKVWVCVLLTTPLLLHMVVPWHWLHDPLVQCILTTPVYLIGILHFGRSGWNSLRTGIPNMDVLIAIGTTAAYGYSLAGLLFGLGANFVFFETAAAIITLVFVGNWLEARSVARAGSAIRELSALQPTIARRIVRAPDSEQIEEIPLSALQLGDLVRINTGDKVPSDGVVVSGTATVNEAMITGESVAVVRSSGEKIIGGTIVTAGSVTAEIKAIGAQTILATIIQLVREAQSQKPRIQRLGDLVAGIFTPVVLLISVVTFLVTTGVLGLSTTEAMIRAVAVLVIACPCAMGLATPTAVMVAIGRAAKLGILVRSGRALELLAQTKVAVFDKTGTLTTGKMELMRIIAHEVPEDRLRAIVRALESHSSHPIARSLVPLLADAPTFPLTEVHEERGVGVRARSVRGVEYAIGTPRLLPHTAGTCSTADLVVTQDGALIGELWLAESLRPGVAEVFLALKAAGIRTVLLSGDRQEKCAAVANQLGIDESIAEQSPEQKQRKVQELRSFGVVAFIGDGINDAPALAAADIGVSLAEASSIAIQSAQVVLGAGQIQKLITAFTLSRATLRTIKQNLFWAFSYNIVAIPIAAAGYLSPMVGAIAMGFSDVMTIGNSLRLRNKRL